MLPASGVHHDLLPAPECGPSPAAVRATPYGVVEDSTSNANSTDDSDRRSVSETEMSASQRKRGGTPRRVPKLSELATKVFFVLRTRRFSDRSSRAPAVGACCTRPVELA